MSQTKENIKNEEGPEFGIERVYIKNVSFEAPGVPEVFKAKEWRPDVNLDLHTEAKPLEDDVQEVVLRVTVTAKLEDKTAFVAEVEQAGIFAMKGFDKDQMHHMLGSFCPNVLFPYARENVSSLVNRGGFPHIYLAPVNFEALYQQHMSQQQEGNA